MESRLVSLDTRVGSPLAMRFNALCLMKKKIQNRGWKDWHYLARLGCTIVTIALDTHMLCYVMLLSDNTSLCICITL